jgi:hypothetical protein
MKSWLIDGSVEGQGEEALDARENSDVVGESLNIVERGLGESGDFAWDSL